MKKRLLIIGAGGVGGVVTRKAAALPKVFPEIMLASRNEDKCLRIAENCPRPIRTARLDADDVPATVSLVGDFRPDLLLNVALPYQDISLMRACLETGTDYLDTANYEDPASFGFYYGPQWDFDSAYRDAGIMGLLGCGFDPGVTNIFCAWADKHLFDEIHTLDIMDCNGGDHGRAFATNFNPEINIREITRPGKYWENGAWHETPPLGVSRVFDFPEIGPRTMYLMYHEELESLSKNFPGLRRARFWMTFGEEYLTHLRVLENVGMTRIDPVDYEGHPVVPLRFLKALLPEPSTLGDNYRGKTNIGCLMEGVKDGQPRRVHIYNVCDHAECYREVGAQAVSYTTGVPAMIGAMLMLNGTWRGKGVFNVEEFDPDPFMEALKEHGLPWVVAEPEEGLGK